MRCLFAYNPVSGKGKIKKKLGYIVKKLSQKFETVKLYQTKGPGELSKIAREACGNFDVFIFSGGDGTIHEVICGLAEQENKPLLGYIPTGTVNDVARSMGIKRSIKGALKTILEGNIEQFDVMKLNDRYAFYAVACGAMTTSSYMTGQKEKNKIGKVAYGIYALKHDFKFDRFKVKYTYNNIESETEAVLVLIFNSKSVSSFMMDKQAVLDDGLVDVAIITDLASKKAPTFFRRIKNMFNSFFLFLFGYRNFKKQRDMICFSTSEATIKIEDNRCWNFDGEKGVEGELNLKVLQKEVSWITPKKKEKKTK